MVPSSWSINSNANIEDAEGHNAAAQELDRQIHITIDDYFSALTNQVQITERAFQSRIEEVDAARLKDEANIASTSDEIGAQQANIKNLTASIAAKNGPLQLATTRLSTRQTRPGIERTTDAAHHSLVDEAEALDATIIMLENRLADATVSLQNLIETLGVRYVLLLLLCCCFFVFLFFFCLPLARSLSLWRWYGMHTCRFLLV